MTQTSCDSGGESPVPDVAGVYTGDLVYRISYSTETLTLASRLHIVAVQSDATVTITGTLGNEGTAFPAITGEINATGFFTPTAGGSVGEYRDPTCGQVTTTSSSLVFSDETLRIQESYVTESCGTISASGQLIKAE